ncbi:hypothetical protein DXG01_017076 [Tephrocybe rancida]|nr:hypothetical protein DXG01_017076 [Tephrocybe rancida]
MDSVEIQRPEVLILLDCMGVNLAKNTKIPDDALNKRFGQTLDGAQRFADLLAPITPVNPSSLSKWKSTDVLLKAVSRLNMAEAYQNMISGRNRVAAPTSTSQEDTFTEVRQVLMGIANHYQQGHKTFVMNDNEGLWCIIARVVDVHIVPSTKDVPIFSILYKVVHRPSNMGLNTHLGQIFGKTVVSISTTQLERKYLLKLFAMNTRRLFSDYKPRRERHEGTTA